MAELPFGGVAGGPSSIAFIPVWGVSLCRATDLRLRRDRQALEQLPVGPGRDRAVEVLLEGLPGIGAHLFEGASTHLTDRSGERAGVARLDLETASMLLGD